MKKLWNKQLGSQWRKWDLHIHSVHSKESRAKLTVRDIFDSAISKEISVIAVTDHSNVTGLDEIWELHEKTFEIDGMEHKYSDYIEFIPGVELKTDKGNKPIHMIALFPKEINRGIYVEKVDRNFLESNFLSKIGCSYSDILAAGQGNYQKGLLDCDVDFEDSCGLVKELGGIVIVHNGTKHGGFDEGLSHSSSDPTPEEIESHFNALKERLMLNCVDICEIPNDSRSNLRDKDFYLKRFSKPCIISSDSHESYEGKKYSWIKADPCFEGLKQVLYEPQYRLRLGEFPPIDTVHKIERVVLNFPSTTKIEGEHFCIKPDTEILFSPNLTCFIGGRGSGKSTVLNLIHEKLKPGTNTFFKRYKLNLPKDTFIKDFVKIDSDEEEKQIEFFSQNEIEEFALDFEKFTDTLFPRLLKLGNNVELVDASTKLNDHLEKVNSHIKDVENLNYLLTTASSLNKRKKAQENIVSSLNDETYFELSQKLDLADKDLRRINSSKKKFDDMVKSLKITIAENQIDNVENEYDVQRVKLKQSIQNAVDACSEQSNFSDISTNLSILTQDLANLKQKLNIYLESKGLKDDNLADVASSTEEVNRLNEQLANILLQINNTKQSIEVFTFEDNLKQIYLDEINKKINEQNQHLTNLSSQVKPITLKYEFNSEKAKQHILKFMIEIFSEIESFQNIKQADIERHLFCIDPQTISDKSAFIVAMQKVSNAKSKTLTSLVDYFSAGINFVTFKLHVKRIFSDVNAFKMIRVLYDGKQLENTSFGQRCTAAIILLIKLGNTPIIIDEPEGHLDSMLVANYLVSMIKENKQQRQIIFATHNANFAINGDAELINVLEVNADNKTYIVPTTIENLLQRDKLLQLEGGKTAFENREKKYQII